MQYLPHPNAKESFITLVDNDYKYIIKARRHKVGDIIALRNLSDEYLYQYQIETISKKEVVIKLLQSKPKRVEAQKALHIGWCVIDPKSIEKHIASLNEIGVARITFIYCDRSQKNFKIDFTRLEKILINSSSQCGRSSTIQLSSIESLKAFKEAYPQSFMLNFSNHYLNQEDPIDTIVIGCEGGFTQDERELFSEEEIIGLETPLILKSESAAVAVSSKLIL